MNEKTRKPRLTIAELYHQLSFAKDCLRFVSATIHELSKKVNAVALERVKAAKVKKS